MITYYTILLTFNSTDRISYLQRNDSIPNRIYFSVIIIWIEKDFINIDNSYCG